MHTPAPSDKTFSAAVAPFVELARIPAADLLPVIPHDAELRAGTHVDPAMRGKVPGRYWGGAWSGLGGTWAVEGIGPALQRKAAEWPTANVGLRAASFPAVDIDVASPEVRDLIERLAVEYLGPAPVRTRAGAPRSLLVYRAEGDEPIRKIRLEFELAGVAHAIEVLATGQQYLVAGRHPSGADYGWREGFDLRAWGVDGLTPVTADDLRRFAGAMVAAMSQQGAILRRSRSQQGAAGVGSDVAEMDALVPVQLALDALRAVPNDEQHFPFREDLVTVLASFKAAVGNKATSPRLKAAVCAWATASDWCDGAYFDTVWDSLTHVRTDANLLFRKARSVGWKGSAKADFQPVEGEEAEEAEQAMQEAEAGMDEVDEVLSAAAKQLVYWPTQQRWIVVGTGELLTSPALRYHSIGLSVAPAGVSNKRASDTLLINSGRVRRVVGQTYLPGADRLVQREWEGQIGLWYNRWKPALPLAAAASSVQPWLNHVEWLFPTQAERAVLLDWMAYLVQRPGQKIRWAPIIVGPQGVGKDAMLKPLIAGLGNHNVSEISPADLVGPWNDFYESQLVIVQEMMRLDKIDTYEKIKAVITGTGAGTVRINRKFEPAYPVQNLCAFAFLTNHIDAIALSRDDRRFFVIECEPQERREAGYYDALHDFYAQGGLAAVVEWLRQRDLAGFVSDGAPMTTAAKEEMQEAATGVFDDWFSQQLEHPKGLWQARTVLTSEEVLATCRVNMNIPADVRDKANKWAIGRTLRALGWRRRPAQMRLADGARVRLWCRTKELVSSGDPLLRARYEQEAKPARGQEFDAA